MALERIWLATDLSDEVLEPWAHALRICATSGVDLRVLHVHKGESPPWEQLPTLRLLLTQWGFLSEDAGLDDFRALGFKVRLEALDASNPRGLLGAMVEVHAPDLLVLGSHRPVGLERLLDGSISEELARRAPRSALIIPDRAQNFVEPISGNVRLRKILIPAGEKGAQRAVDAAAELVAALDAGPVEVVFVHVGPYGTIPQLTIPEGKGWTSRTQQFSDGQVVARVLETAASENVDLIAMATHGRDSWSDALWGSRTERVLRKSPVPVLMTKIFAVREAL